ncbi:MAG: hypothetical protein RMM17_14215 [Acidobacteriota bacterium]|nr:hypothetical protein [Blastocatellia bacterium]MDW8413824.1 hypothetical protein [Acidobacteriota bacterium]
MRRDMDAVLRKVLLELPTECSGFDADLATAYLEKKLTVEKEAAYQAHLAQCQSCRRMTTELAMMASSEKSKSVGSIFFNFSDMFALWSNWAVLRYALLLVILVSAPIILLLRKQDPELVTGNRLDVPNMTKVAELAHTSLEKADAEVRSEVKTAAEGASRASHSDRRSVDNAKHRASLADSKETERLELAEERRFHPMEDSELAEAPATATPSSLSGGAGMAPARREASMATAQKTKIAIESENLASTAYRVADKVFYWVQGKWVDEQYSEDIRMERIRFKRGDEAYRRAIEKHPVLEEYFKLQGRVIVVFGSVVYDCVE